MPGTRPSCDPGGPEPGLYAQRFPEDVRPDRAALWRVLCEDFFQRYVGAGDTVLDVGAGFCDFINHIRCAEKVAVDVQDDVRTAAAPGVRVHVGPADELGWLPDGCVDVAFASNVFEHFPAKAAVVAALREIHRVLRPGGRVLILQPNIRYAYKVYWDFLDHHLPFSDRSMLEALAVAGFRAVEVRPRFLPYTSVGWMPRWGWLVRLYLRLPPAQWLFGRQMFLVGVAE
jgi:SAM-dependent methyltransferase